MARAEHIIYWLFAISLRCEAVSWFENWLENWFENS